MIQILGQVMVYVSDQKGLKSFGLRILDLVSFERKTTAKGCADLKSHQRIIQKLV